jgi:hypothetical protein
MIPGYAFRLALGYTILMLALCGAAPLMSPGAVLINEIMADPASDWDGDGAYQYRDDEWVEVINTGPGIVDLAYFGLKDASSETARLRLNGILEPGEVKVFYGSDAVAWQQEQGTGSAGLSLNNSGDVLDLLFYEEDGPQILDTVAYQAHEAEDDRSCGLDPETGAWMLYDALNPHSGDAQPLGTGCAPTPGLANLCQPQVGVTTTSLDALKTHFR